MSRGTFPTKLWLLLCCIAVSNQSSISITKFVVPQAVQSDENVELQCSYDLGDERKDLLYVKWWFNPLHKDDDKMQIYQRIADLPGVPIRHDVVLKENELDTILLLNVTPAVSGTYECEVYNIGEARKHQDMIVFTPGTGPQLNVTTVADGLDDDEDEDLLIQCEASDVAPSPDFIITVNGVEANITEYVTGPDEDGLYDIVGNVTISKDDYVDVRCELFYINPNVTHPPYFDTEQYTGAGSTTESPEDNTGLDSTTDSLQDESDFGSQLQASWILLAVPVIAQIFFLI